MRLTKENYELLMFDLLEGNLSEQQSLDLMAQIESDEFFFKEWKLFKSTVLVADESIQFERKEELLKDEDDRKGGFIIPMRRLYSVATAACILLLIGFGIQRFGSNEQIVDQPTPTINSNSDQQKSALDKNNTETGSIEEPIVIEESTVEQNNKVNSVVKDRSPLPKSEKLNVSPVVEKDDFIVKEEVEKIEVEDKMNSKDLERLVQEDIDIPSFEETEHQGEKNVDASVTYSFTERIRGTIANTIAMVSNPKIRFIPEWKQRRINIELETNGYLAVATVDPFNKKK